MKRLLALALSVSMAAVVAASCRDVVSPEPVALVPSLCELLAQCEGSDDWQCPTAVAEPFDGLDEDARTDAYARFLEADCLADCRSARKCRDLRPLCKLRGGECEDDSACCGYTEGIAECRGNVLGTCCAPNGAPCDGDGDCCDGECNSGHCGNYACTLVDEKCESHFECCTRRCDFSLDEPVCALNDCSIVGAPCEVAGDCCDDAATCEVDGQGVRVCQIAICDDGCNPLAEDNCCVQQGLGFCLLLANNETVCGDPNCPPAGVECGGDDDCGCASDAARSLVCDDAGFPHCAECRSAGATCDPDGNANGCCGGTCDATTSTCAP